MELDAIDVAIAEYLGWSQITPQDSSERRYGIRSNSAGKKYPIAMIPQYHKDLNAMHDAEMGLAKNLRIAYSNLLTSSGRCREFHRMSSVAISRAHAYIRVIGKWQDEIMEDNEEDEIGQLSTHVAV
jgi:hypothetical protein